MSDYESDEKLREYYYCKLCKISFNQKSDIIRHLSRSKHLNKLNIQQKVYHNSLLYYINSNPDLKTKYITVDDEDILKNVDLNKPILIDSAGGVGKTFVTLNIVKHYSNIVALGPTNQVCCILRTDFPSARTFHSYFGWSQDVDEKGNDKNVWKTPKIKKNTIFVIDEISMLCEQCYSLYMYFIHGKYKVIFMGDSAQIGPIKSSSNSKGYPEGVVEYHQEGDYSLFLDLDCNKFTLTINERSNNVELSNMLLKMRDDVLNRPHISLKIESNWEFDLKHIKENKFEDFLFLTHENKTVNCINKMVRNYISPNSNKEYDEGDKCIINKWYSMELPTSKRFTILTSKEVSKTYSYVDLHNPELELKDLCYTKKKDVIFKGFDITTLKDFRIFTICREEQVDFRNFIKENTKAINKLTIKNLKKYDFQKAKKNDFKKELKNELSIIKKRLHRENKRKRMSNCLMNYSFASTIHKAQGMGIGTVYFHNYTGLYYNNNLKYTACSRVINELKVFNYNFRKHMF